MEWKYLESRTGSSTILFENINGGNFTELYVEAFTNNYNYLTFYIPKKFSVGNGMHNYKMMRNGWYLSSSDNGQCALNVYPDKLTMVSFHTNGNDYSNNVVWSIWYR